MAGENKQKENEILYPVNGDRALANYARKTYDLGCQLFHTHNGKLSSVDPDLVNDALQFLIGGEMQECAWILPILAKERLCHLKFFGEIFDLTKFKNTLKRIGQYWVTRWLSEYSLKLIFFPNVTMSRNKKFPGWEIKPPKSFFEDAENGKFVYKDSKKQISSLQLSGCSALIDVSNNGSFSSASSSYDSWISDILYSLRCDHSIDPYIGSNISGQRLWVSGQEIEVLKESLKHYFESNGLRQEKGNKNVVFRIERYIEYNVISQIYDDIRQEDKNPEFLCFFEEYYSNFGNRCFGGQWSRGYLADIRHKLVKDRSTEIGFRPIIILD